MLLPLATLVSFVTGLRARISRSNLAKSATGGGGRLPCGLALLCGLSAVARGEGEIKLPIPGKGVSIEVLIANFSMAADAEKGVPTAEQILDAISSATGVPESFKGYPLGTRAFELAEGGVNHPFLQAFSKPVRDVSCECAREEDPSLPQMLHLLNNKGMLAKVDSPKSRLAAALREKKSDAALIEEIYLATLSRRPTAAEVGIAIRHIEKLGDRVKGLQDLQYALFNLGEFLLRH